MNGIQVVLLTGIGLISLVFISKTRKKRLYILMLMIAVAMSVVFILWPDVTNRIANVLGVGRGADLIFYISILIFWFIIVQLFSRIRRLEELVTELIRKDAIAHAATLQVDEQKEK